MKINNKGVTLVELLVSLAVSSVIMMTLGYILITSLHLYEKTNETVALQNEAQTAMNMVCSLFMDADGMVLTEQALGTGEACLVLLGVVSVDMVQDNKVSFQGKAIVWDPAYQEIYLLDYTTGISFTWDSTASEQEAVNKAAEEIKKQLLAMEWADRRKLLLASYISDFSIEAAAYNEFPEPEQSINPLKPSEEITIHYYKSPFAVKVGMELSSEYSAGKVLTRNVEKDVRLRNRMQYIYLQRTDTNEMIKYYAK